MSENLNQQYVRLFREADHFDVRCCVCGRAENMSTSSEIVAERIGKHPGSWKCKRCQGGGILEVGHPEDGVIKVALRCDRCGSSNEINVPESLLDDKARDQLDTDYYTCPKCMGELA